MGTCFGCGRALAEAVTDVSPVITEDVSSVISSSTDESTSQYSRCLIDDDSEFSTLAPMTATEIDKYLHEI